MQTLDVDFKTGSDNTAGIGQYIWYAPISDIQALPETDLNDSASDTGDFTLLVTISNNIIMKPGKTFKKMYVTIETGGITSTAQGEFDGKSRINKLEFTHPGSSAEIMGFDQWSKNASLVFLVQEQDGQIRILGHRLYPAKAIDYTGGTGKKTADLKGNEFGFQSVRKGVAPIFKGKVYISPAGSIYDQDSNNYQDLFAA